MTGAIQRVADGVGCEKDSWDRCRKGEGRNENVLSLMGICRERRRWSAFIEERVVSSDATFVLRLSSASPSSSDLEQARCNRDVWTRHLNPSVMRVSCSKDCSKGRRRKNLLFDRRELSSTVHADSLVLLLHPSDCRLDPPTKEGSTRESR